MTNTQRGYLIDPLGNKQRRVVRTAFLAELIDACDTQDRGFLIAVFARNGFMKESIGAVVHYAFHSLDLSRLEAACLPENIASRTVLEKSNFKYEGVAQSYLQINGRWRNHVLYSCLRSDRRGKTDV